jgi:hypothetical protein
MLGAFASSGVTIFDSNAGATMSPNNRPPRLNELTQQLLASGVGIDSPSTEVEPHDVLGGVRTDPRLAWQETCDLARQLGLDPVNMASAKPPEWGTFQALAISSPALPMALGCFPQMVRDPLPLLMTAKLTELLPTRVPTSGLTSLKDWAKKTLHNGSITAACLAAGCAMIVGEDCQPLLASRAKADATTPGDCWANQQAAALWLAGEHHEALAIWRSLSGLAATFNTGMALLFLGHSDDAKPYLQAAVDALPETTGWNHLAQLFLLAANRR